MHISSAPWSKILSKLFLAKVQRMFKIQINLWSKCAAIVLHLEEFGCSGLLSADPEPNRNSELLCATGPNRTRSICYLFEITEIYASSCVLIPLLLFTLLEPFLLQIFFFGRDKQNQVLNSGNGGWEKMCCAVCRCIENLVIGLSTTSKFVSTGSALWRR